MLRKLKLWMNGGKDWKTSPLSQSSFLLGPGPHADQPRSGAIQRNIHTGGVAEWLYYGSPELDEADATFMVMQRTPSHGLRPMTVYSENHDVHRLAACPVTFRDVFYEITTCLGKFRAQEISIYVEGDYKSGLAFLSRFGDVPVYCQGWMTESVGKAMQPTTLGEALNGFVLRKGLPVPAADAWLRERLALDVPVSVRLLRHDPGADLVL
jgi:hypothetical protein